MTTPSPKTAGEALLYLRTASEATGKMSDHERELFETLARAVEDAERFRWMEANCYLNRHEDRDFPHVVIQQVCVGEISEKHIGAYLVGPKSGVGIVRLSFAIDEAMRNDTARRARA